MNITGTITDGLGENQIDHLDNSRFTRHFLEVSQVCRVIDFGCGTAIGGSWEIRENLLEEDFFNQLPNALWVTENSPNGYSEKHSKLIHSPQVFDTSNRNKENSVLACEREHLSLDCKFGLNCIQRIRGWFDFIQIHGRECMFWGCVDGKVHEPGLIDAKRAPRVQYPTDMKKMAIYCLR